MNTIDQDLEEFVKRDFPMYRRAQIGMIYAISWDIPGIDTPIKFGSAIGLSKRLLSYTTYSPYRIILHVAWPTKNRWNPRIEEFELHRQLAAHRLKNEWFHRSPEVLSLIEAKKERWRWALTQGPSVKQVATEEGVKRFDWLSTSRKEDLEVSSFLRCADMFHSTHVELKKQAAPPAPYVPIPSESEAVEALIAKLQRSPLLDHDHWLVTKAALRSWGVTDKEYELIKQRCTWYRMGNGGRVELDGLCDLARLSLVDLEDDEDDDDDDDEQDAQDERSNKRAEKYRRIWQAFEARNKKAALDAEVVN